MFHYEASWLETVLGEKGHIFLGKQTIRSSEDTGSSEAIDCDMGKILALGLICKVGGSELVFEALFFAEHAFFAEASPQMKWTLWHVIKMQTKKHLMMHAQPITPRASSLARPIG